MFQSVAECDERLGELHTQATALVNLAKEQKRDITDDEEATFAEIKAESERIKEKDRPNAEWLEKEQERLAASTRQTGLQPTGQDETTGQGSRIVVPATARRSCTLQAYKGPEGEADAYKVGQFIRACVGHADATQWCRDHGIGIRAALSTDSDQKGGILVPLEMERAIIDLREEYGVARKYCRVMPMGSDSTIVPRRASGLTAYFVGENSLITASDKAWNQVELNPRKLAALCKYSSELAEDSIISIAEDLTKEIAYAFAVKEDQCLFLGDGTSTYGGISGLITECTTATATTVTAPTADIAFSDVILTTFESMVGKLPAYPGIRPVWYIHKAAYAASMMRLIDAAGGNTTSTLETGPNMASFLGYPVQFVNVMNSTLTDQASAKGLCYFGDIAMATTLGDRRGVAVDISTDRYFEYDQIGIKGTERFDINVHDVGDTSNAGAVVMLAFPAS
jgi:HK97 family phage major capsid protein